MESECLAIGQIGVTFIEINSFDEALEYLSVFFKKISPQNSIRDVMI